MRVVFIIALCLAPTVATAHISMTYPPPRTTAQKPAPCGQATDQRSGTVTTFSPGETVTITWDETINHPSHYRIAFDADGTDDFVDPIDLDDRYTNEAVLLDGIEDSDTHTFAIEVTLPDAPCDNCTLQLIQVMYDKAPPLCSTCTYGDNDIYYQCADIVIAEGGTGGDDGGPPESDAGPAAGDSTSAGGDAGPGGGDDSGEYGGGGDNVTPAGDSLPDEGGDDAGTIGVGVDQIATFGGGCAAVSVSGWLPFAALVVLRRRSRR